MTEQERIHLEAAKYANSLKEQFLQKVKEGAIEPRTKEMQGWIWMAHYEGYRDALTDAALLAPKPGQLKDRGAK